MLFEQLAPNIRQDPASPHPPSTMGACRYRNLPTHVAAIRR
jgi:hypothetical protein